MDLSDRKTRHRLAAVAGLAVVVFIAIGLVTGFAFGWIALGVCWLVVSVLALFIGPSRRWSRAGSAARHAQESQDESWTVL